MNGISDSAITRLVGRSFPRTPDFYGLMNEKCDTLMEAIDAFVEYIEDTSAEKATSVREIEKRGGGLKTRKVGTLDRFFAKPMDRDGLYRAIFTLDMLIDHTKTTGREMAELEVKPDASMMQIADEFKRGAQALQEGFRKLTTSPTQAQEDVSTARKAEFNTRKIYRRALAELFKDDEMLEKLDAGEPDKKARTQAMHAVLEMMRHREIYRRLSNGADRLAWATDSLQDIIVESS